MLDKVHAEGRTSLSESEGKEILKAYGVSAGGGDRQNGRGAAKAAAKIGFPVVLKIDSPDIAHKSDVGGVVVGAASEEAVRNDFELMMSKVASRVPGPN